MKKILLLILFLALGWYFLNRTSFSLCATPLRYRVDTVDNRFNLPREKFVTETQKAVDTWNKAFGGRLIAYEPATGNLSVNLIYDERQRLNLAVVTQESTLNKQQQSLDQQIAQYKKDEQTFLNKLNALNAQIQDWNSKGGAPTDIYNQLLQEQQDLAAQAKSLQQRAKSLNLTSASFNTQVGKLNQDINAFNASLSARPEEGIYISNQNRIEVYFDITETELLHTLEHEFGHALGLPHTDDKTSIMSVMTNQVVSPSKTDLDELRVMCASRSPWLILTQHFGDLMQFLQSRFAL